MLPECQLFGTLGCHLCEQAEGLLMPLVERGLLVELLDIADNERWVDEYGLRIPVLREGGRAAKSSIGRSNSSRSCCFCSDDEAGEANSRQ